MDEAWAGRAVDTLRTAADFRRVLKEGRRLDGPLFLLVIATKPAGPVRVGLAVGRRVGGAVVRNRAKRRLREAFRHRLRPGEGRPHDCVVIGKAGLGRASLGAVEGELQRRLARYEERLGRRAHRVLGSRH